MLRAAVIGCGAIGAGDERSAHPDVGVYTHAGAYATCRATRLVGVADADPGRRAAAARRFDVPRAYRSLEEVLEAERPELVSLCTPDSTHAVLLGAILEAPSVRGVLAEKPLADDAAQAGGLVARARERGIVLAVNYSRRYAPALQTLATDLAAGALGELQHVHGAYGKGLRHNGTHWLDLLRMLAGEPTAVRGWDRLGEPGGDPSLDAELLLAGGGGARLAALDAGAFTAFELELTGTRGRVRLAEAGHRIERWTVGRDPRYAGHAALVPAGRVDRALADVLLRAVESLVAAVGDGEPPACTGEDAVRALQVAEAITASAAAGAPARVPAPGPDPDGRALASPT